MSQINARLSKSLLDQWYDQVIAAKPFLRWAGGKSVFLLRYSKIFPKFDGKLIEPFLGSGAVFFHLVRKSQRMGRALLGDTNRELISTYEAVRDQPEDVYRRLEVLQAEYTAAVDKAVYYNAIRDTFNATRPRVDAAVFIFVNRTCWNGLYRVNRDGRFNVPYGAPSKSSVIPEKSAFFAASAALQQAQLRAASWENSVAMAEPGDLVFLAPPYYSDIVSDDTKYSRFAFRLADHKRLAGAVQHLSERRISFVLTNSGEEEMISMYQRLGLKTTIVSVPRTISGKTDSRIAASEVIVTPPWMNLEV